MKDQELFSLVKKAVQQRKQIPHHSESKNFAQRYCEKELKKKYNPQHMYQTRMGHIMKNFTRLQTYFNLPDLIRDLRQVQVGMKKQKKVGAASMHVRFKPESKKNQPQPEKPQQGKQYTEMNQKRNTPYHRKVNCFLQTMESNNQWKTQIMKNNSVYHMSSVDNNLKESFESLPSQESVKLFSLLQSFLKNSNEFSEEQKSTVVEEKKVDPEKRKENARFLHKVSSYLHIILENQHRNKWNNKSESKVIKIKTSPNKQKRSLHIKKKTFNKPDIPRKLSDTKAIEEIKEQTRKIRGDSPKHTKYFQNFNMTTSVDPRALHRSILRRPNDSGLSTSPNLGPSKQRKPMMSSIKDNFTFRRRSVKQKIIKKIDKFIYEIDEETHCNKKENHYFNNEIDKLQGQMKRTYGRYRKETIAGDQDIQNLTKLAKEYSIMSPSRRNSKTFEEEGLVSLQRQKSKEEQS